MAAAEDLGALVNKSMTTTETEDPLSKTPASIHPDKNSLAQTLPSASARTARDRKQVDFFAPDDVKITEKLVVKEGKGTRLGDIPNVLFRLQKTTGRDELLEDLHMLLYHRKGKLATRKKEIQNFSGYTYTEGEESELRKDEERLNRWNTERLNSLLDLLDLPRGRDETGTKEGKVKRILDFLQAPQKTGTKDLNEQETKKKAQMERKRKREAQTADKKEKAEARADKKAAKVAKRTEKAASKRKDEPASGKKSKKARVQKQAEEDSEEEEQQEASDDDEDELPLGVASKLPSDAELEQQTLAILKSINVLDFSLKQLLRQLGEKYDMDFNKLKKKKLLIKQVAIMYCSAKGPPEDAEDDPEGDDDQGLPDPEPPVQDELEQEAKDEIMEEAGIPKEQQQEVSLEDAITAAPSTDAPSPNKAETAATKHLDQQPPVPNVTFSADNA